jgi:hypothetical protein
LAFAKEQADFCYQNLLWILEIDIVALCLKICYQGERCFKFAALYIVFILICYLLWILEIDKVAL